MAPPLSTLVFPFLELIVVTALSWMLIGWMDVHGVDTGTRNFVVLVWFLLALWRFVWPLVRSRRQRFVVTNKRVLYVRGGRGNTESIPLAQIRDARRSRGGVSIGVFGYPQPVYFPDVGKSKRVEELIRRQLP